MKRVSTRALALALALGFVGGCLDVTHNDGLDQSATRALLAASRRRSDVVIALGCPADEASGVPSLCERCRVKSALRAYRDGEAAAVIFTGGAAHNRYVEADAMATLARARGLPETAVFREGQALTTWMNLRLSQRIMRRHGWRTALIVSTANHLVRARRFAHWYGIDARYRACDWDEPADSEEEWRGPITPARAPGAAPAATSTSR